MLPDKGLNNIQPTRPYSTTKTTTIKLICKPYISPSKLTTKQEVGYTFQKKKIQEFL